MSQSPRADNSMLVANPLDADALRRWPMPDADTADKYTRGTVLVIGGSRSTPGAVLLAGVAALRMGAGRLKMATDDTVAGSLAVAVPEAMVIGLPSSAAGLTISDELARQIAEVEAVVVGPGMIADSPPTKLLAELCDLTGDDTLIVIDALALVAFDELDPRRRDSIAARAVLTPNRQETSRIANLSDGHDLADALRTVSEKTGAVVSSFGIVQAPDGRSWRTSNHSTGLGTSGSGDVLAGLVVGAGARCRDRLQAACWGTFAHVEAGRRLSDDVASAGYLARELLDHVPQCLACVAPSADLPASHEIR